jgi:protein ImuB
MSRILTIHLPQWPFQRLSLEQPELRRRPLALYAESKRRGTEIVRCSRLARNQGVVPGLSLAEAQAVLRKRSARTPQQAVQFLPSEPQADRQALKVLAERCRQFSPTVGLAEEDVPESLVLDIGGCAHLFGGEQGLTAAVLRAFRGWKLFVRVAVAETAGAAWAIARYGELGAGRRSTAALVSPEKQPEIVRRLPVAALRLSPKVVGKLHKLDLRQVGQLEDLPRSSLPARFGKDILHRLDQALGRLPELLTPERPLPVIDARRQLEYPTTDRRNVEFIAKLLIEEIVAQLEPRQEGVRRLDCRLHTTGRETIVFSVGLVVPSVSASHLHELVKLQFERLFGSAVEGQGRGARSTSSRLSGDSRPSLAGGRLEIEQVQFTAIETAVLQFSQREFFENGAHGLSDDGRRRLALLIEQLSSRLGEQAVLAPQLVPDALPESAVRYQPVVERQGESPRRRATDFSGNAASLAGYRPLYLKPRPIPIEVVSATPGGPPLRFFLGPNERSAHVVVAHWGPERIETGWWRGRQVRRDYYGVETAAGGRFWLFRRLDDGQWFWHGCFE